MIPTRWPRTFVGWLLVAVVPILLPLTVASAAGDTDAAVEALTHHLGLRLRQLLVWHYAQPRALSARARRTRLAEQLPGPAARMQTNADATAAVVNVILDGTVPADQVRASLAALGATVFAAHDIGRAGSVLSARLPLNAAETAVHAAGVYSIGLVHRPWQSVGKVTSFGY